MSNKGFKSERLETQARFYVDPKKFKTPEEREDAIRRAKANFLRIGRSIQGVRIVYRWRNPDNKNPRHADWKYSDDPGQSLYDFYQTIAKRALR